MVIIFLGQIGSGKTVQAAMLAKKLKAEHFSIGSLVRQRNFEDARVHRGELLPDDFVNKVVADEITAVGTEVSIIIDGFPRRIAQKEWLDGFLVQQGRTDIRALYLSVSDQEVDRRLLARGRDDDTPEAITKRKAIFNQEVIPVIESYKVDGVLHEINGEGDIQQIHQRIKEELEL